MGHIKFIMYSLIIWESDDFEYLMLILILTRQIDKTEAVHFTLVKSSHFNS